MNPEKPGLINGHMTKSTRSFLIIDHFFIDLAIVLGPWMLLVNHIIRACDSTMV